MQSKTQLQILKDIDSYLKSFEKSKFENEHLFGLWHGLKVAQAVARGEDPSRIELPEWPEKWGFEQRAEDDSEDSQ